MNAGERTESHISKHVNTLGVVKSNKLPLLCPGHISNYECLRNTTFIHDNVYTLQYRCRGLLKCAIWQIRGLVVTCQR